MDQDYALRKQDRATVIAALQAGEYEAIATSGQGALDELVHLAIELGVFEALKLIRVDRQRSGIPDELLLHTAAVLPFVEAIGLRVAAGELFKDKAIEFRELKEGWNLERAPWSRTNDTVVAARVTFTLIAFNIAQLAKTAQGWRLTDRGIRRLRRELTATYGPAPVVVFTTDAYAVFHVDEVMALAGLSPKHSLRRKPPSGPPPLS